MKTMADIELILGDCLEKLKAIPSDSIDLVLTDPPYGLDKEMANDTKEGLLQLLSLSLKEIRRVAKDKHSILIFFDAGKNLPIIFKAFEESGLTFQRYICFYKPADCSMPHNRVLRKSEALLVCSKNETINHDGEEYMHDVIKQNIIGKELLYSSTAWHPSIKPASVCKKLIKVNTLEGDVVLDPFMGSGTTGVAAVALSRKFIGMEIDPTYFKMAEKRIMETKKQSRLTDTETAVKPIPPTDKSVGILGVIL